MHTLRQLKYIKLKVEIVSSEVAFNRLLLWTSFLLALSKYGLLLFLLIPNANMI